MSDSLKDKIIKTLIDSQKIKQKDVEDAMMLQKRRGISLDKALIEKGLVDEKDVLMLLVKELNIPFINLGKYKIDPSLQKVVTENIARQYKIIPLSELDMTITIATSDPLNVFVMDDLKNLTGKEIDVVMSTESDILKAIEGYYGVDTKATVNEITKDLNVDDFEIITETDDEEGGEDMADEGEKAPVVRMVNLIVKEAIKQRASDIHMEPMVDCMRVRYRVDGVLKNILEIPKESQNSVIVRIKIMSRLDITVNQRPQDGRFKLKLGGREVDFRVSLLPTTFGQKVVMRVLDKESLSVGLAGLGFDGESLEKIKSSMKKPFGMVLVTGPTGSGKSTTLYSIINELNTPDRNIITVEDPVEYLIDGLTQIQAHPEIGLTFAEGLRAILRQSPDIVLVGEIRDNETADIAIKASLTGQLVFSTLHTNDSCGALTRLVDMDVEPFLVASSLVMVSAQRLCRKICEHCKEEVKVDQKTLDDMDFEFPKNATFYAGKGCDHCNHTGYRGRMGLTEILIVEDDIRSMLLNGASSDEIKEFACKEKGLVTLWQDAINKCLEGNTTIEEVLRVTSNE